MMKMIDIHNPPPTGRMELFYKIAFTQHELWFLEKLTFKVMWSAAHHRERILELSVYAFMLHRHKTKIQAGEACKLKLSTAEVLALKRLLLTTPVLDGWQNESKSILFKLDQLTVGVQ